MKRSHFLIFVSIVLCVKITHALFVDQFTHRDKVVADSVEHLNDQMRSLISLALDEANDGEYKCYEKNKSRSDKSRDVLFKSLRRGLLDFHLDDFAETSKLIEKKQTLFKDSIFADVYSWPSLYKLGGKMIDTEEVINVDGHQITTKKLARFLGDGFRLYKDQMTTHLKGIEPTERRSLEAVTQHVKGSGILSFADHAAAMAGVRFWLDLCGPSVQEGRCLPGNLISCDERTGKWESSKVFKFDFGNYIDDSWDEGINCSLYSADISSLIVKNIQKVTGKKDFPCPMDPVKCQALSQSPSKKYLSPICANVLEKTGKSSPSGSFTDYTYQPPKKEKSSLKSRIEK